MSVAGGKRMFYFPYNESVCKRVSIVSSSSRGVVLEKLSDHKKDSYKVLDIDREERKVDDGVVLRAVCRCALRFKGMNLILANEDVNLNKIWAPLIILKN